MSTDAHLRCSTENSPRLQADSDHSQTWETVKSSNESQDLSLIQLCKEVYQLTVRSRTSRLLFPVKVRGLNAYFRVKETLLNRRVKTNVYNNLIKIWLNVNMPFKNPAVNYNQFKAAYEHKYEQANISETVLSNFYQNALTTWNSIEDPSFEEIKNACIIIVSKTIVSDDESDFGDILSSFFLTLVNRHQELFSLEEFIYLIQNFEGVNWSDEKSYRKICEDFYVFAKRFIIVDFPLSSVGLSFSKLASMYIKDRVAQGVHTSFKFIEKNIDSYVIKRHQVDPKDFSQDSAENNIYVQRSLVLISKFKKARELLLNDFLQGVKQNKIYNKVDHVLKMEQKYQYTINAVEKGNSLLRDQILNPAYSLVSFSIGKTTDTVNIILKGIDNRFKSKVDTLKSKYTYLKDATLTYYKGFVEITVSRESLLKYGNEIRGEISALYREVRELNAEKLRSLTSSLYEQAVQQFKNRKQAITPGSSVTPRTVL